MYLKIHHFQGHIQDLYLVEYSDKVLMLDGGSRADAKQVEKYFSEVLKRPVSDLLLISVSHMHPDHAAAAQILRRRHNVPVAAFHTVDNWYRGLPGRMQHLFDMAMGWFVVYKKDLKKNRFWYSPILIPDFQLHDKEFLPGFPDWQVFHVPGHTAHDIVLFHHESGVLYAGDLVVGVNNKFMLPFPISLPSCMNKSIQLLENLPWRTIYMAHGGIVERSNMGNDVFEKLRKMINRKLKFPFTFLKYFSTLPSPISEYKRNCD